MGASTYARPAPVSLSEGQIYGPQTVYEASATAQNPLGDKAVTPDGRIFRYIRAGGTALAPGKVAMLGPLVAATSINMALHNSDGAAGDTTLRVTNGGAVVTADQWAGGILTVQDDTGEAHAYHVASNAAAGSGVEGLVTLSDPIVTATGDNTTVTISLPAWSGLVIATAAGGQPMGVPLASITANYYGWIQTGGVAPTWADDTDALGVEVAVSAVDGQTETAVAGESTIGVRLQVGVDTEYVQTFLTIDN